ncbi:coiled-coil domain-containing protein 172 [Phyllobates terribilis]|uniref:coiled-coil domain-containing protein 172 n=1 Tax=Phyllobates terribilis TaxID=111132 RepID=UPI003CCB3AF4
MSVDALYQHIILSEKRAQEQRKVLQEVKCEVSECREKIFQVRGNLRSARAAQEIRVPLLLEKGFQRDLMKKRQDGLEIQKWRLLGENRGLHSEVQVMKDKTASEEEMFMMEVMDYNRNYGLTVNRKELLGERAEAESRSLEEEAEVLGQEIETLRGENIHLNALYRQRNMIQRELSDFQETLRGLDKAISAAAGVTRKLEAEKLSISQKPQSDAECLRLKKELESYREEKVWSASAALRSEIQVLQQTGNVVITGEFCSGSDTARPSDVTHVPHYGRSALRHTCIAILFLDRKYL